MIETKDITKMVAHIVRRDTGIPDASIMHPMREWVLGLLVVVLLVFGGVAFNIMMYQSYHDALTAPVPVVETVVPYKAALVSQAISYYETERKLYESILGAPSVIGQVPATTTATTATVATSTSMGVPAVDAVGGIASSSATTTNIKALIVPQSGSGSDTTPRPAG